MTENELQVYISDMSSDGTWGDGIILSAAVNLYRRPIVIFTLKGEQLIDTPLSFESSSHSHDPIRLGLIYSNHYVSIVRRQALCTESETTFDNEAHDRHQPESNVTVAVNFTDTSPANTTDGQDSSCEEKLVHNLHEKTVSDIGNKMLQLFLKFVFKFKCRHRTCYFMLDYKILPANRINF